MRASLPLVVTLSALTGCGTTSSSSALNNTADAPVMFEDEAAAQQAPVASELVTRGESLLARGDAEAAAALFREAITADASDARAHLDLGLALEMLERLSEAEASYRAAIRANPELAEAHNNLGVLLRDTERPAEAVEVLRAAVEARPALASAHLNLGLALEESGDPAGAMESYRRVIELAPREPTSRIQLGVLQLAAGDRDQALITFRRAVPTAAGSRAMLAALGSGLRRAGDAPMALRVLRQAIEADDDSPAPPGLLAELSLAHYAAGQREDAEQTLRALLEANPRYATAHYLLANMLAAREAFSDAARAYRAYLRVAPDGPHAVQARGRLRAVTSR